MNGSHFPIYRNPKVFFYGYARHNKRGPSFVPFSNRLPWTSFESSFHRSLGDHKKKNGKYVPNRPPAQAMPHHRQHSSHWWSDSLFLQNTTAPFLPTIVFAHKNGFGRNHSSNEQVAHKPSWLQMELLITNSCKSPLYASNCNIPPSSHLCAHKDPSSHSPSLLSKRHANLPL